jgi:hypothetical protein
MVKALELHQLRAFRIDNDKAGNGLDFVKHPSRFPGEGFTE